MFRRVHIAAKRISPRGRSSCVFVLYCTFLVKKTTTQQQQQQLANEESVYVSFLTLDCSQSLDVEGPLNREGYNHQCETIFNFTG